MSKNERQNASDFREWLQLTFPEIGIYTDKDGPGRIHRSEWDFLVFYKNRLLFIEAKQCEKIPDDPRALLKPGQEKGSQKALRAHSHYAILIFLLREMAMNVYSRDDHPVRLKGKREILEFIQEFFGYGYKRD